MDDVMKQNNMENSSTLFEKVIPVRITKSQGYEDRILDLTIRIIMGTSKHHRSTKVLKVQLTNEMDPFFFYSLEVSEEDFQTLKVEQCILVDFFTFPYKFIELLEHCIDASNHDGPTPRFHAILQIRTGDSTFSVVEANQFKHLSHLSLCFRLGNDASIKSYLAGRLAEFKAANTDLHEKLRRTLLSLERALRDNSNLSSEVTELRESKSQTISQMKAEFNMEIGHEKEKAIHEYAELKEKLEKDQADMQNQLRQQDSLYNERITELDKQVRELLDSKHSLDSKVTELGTKLATTEKALQDKLQECKRLRLENQSLDVEKHESAKNFNHNLIRLSALEQEVQDKNELLSKLTKQLESQTSQRLAVEASFKESQASLQRTEEKAAANAAEVGKCNQQIEKLQAELRACKAKIKLKGQVASQQDSLLQERQAAIDKASLENATMKQEIAALKSESDTLKKKSDEMKGKLDEAQEVQKSNQQMIQWLNQQLTDAQLGKFSGANASPRYMFKPSLSFLSGGDSSGRSTTNHMGMSFPSSSGTFSGLSSSAYKSILPASTPFSQSTHSKVNGISSSAGLSATGLSNNASSVNSKPAGNPRSSGDGSLPVVHTVPGPVKVQYKPSHTTNIGSTGAVTPTNHSSALSKADHNSNQWASKASEEITWTVLPRPPLSFVEAKPSELANGTAKGSTNSFCRANGLANGDEGQSPKPPSVPLSSPIGNNR